MTGWTALLWLDWKLLVNRIRSIRNNPRRLIPWVLFIVWLVPSFVLRVTAGSHLSRGPTFDSLGVQLAPLGVVVPGLALFAVGLGVWRASITAPAAFQSAADARFVIGAGFDARAVFTWLSLRTGRRLITSFVLMLIVIQALYLPSLGLTVTAAIDFSLAFALFGAIVFGSRLLAFSLQRTVPAVPVGAIGLVAAIAGAVAFLLPPGSWVLGALGGSVGAQVALLALAVACCVGGIALARDCYPELWAASQRVIALRRAMGSRRMFITGLSGVARQSARASNPRPERQVQSSAGQRVPAGPLAVFWKEWLSIKRSRGGLQLQALFGAGAIALGAVVGLASARAFSVALIAAVSFGLLTFLSTWVGGLQLARDLGSPLWWLSSSALWSRLTVWTLARSIRFVVPLVLFIEAALVTSGQYLWAIPLAPIPPLLLFWVSQTVSLAVYSMLPARSDYRLAVTMRMIAMYLIFAPLGLSILPGLLLRNPILVVLMPTGVLAAIAVGLLAFASWRIQGNGLVFAMEERQ